MWRRGSRKRARRRKKSLKQSASWKPSAATRCILLTLAGNARNLTAQAEESLAALEREAERLEAEMGQARNERGESGRRERTGAAAV